MQDSGIQVLFQGNNLLRIIQGLGVTIGISILSVLLSMIRINSRYNRVKNRTILE